MAASKSFDSVQGRKHQWIDVVIRVNEVIWAEAEAEEAEANVGVPKGFWERVKGWIGNRNQDGMSRL
jgi:hypothetical protein